MDSEASPREHAREEEDRILARSKELLAGDRLGLLQGKGKGRESLVSEEVKATENALKALQQALRDADSSKWQKSPHDPDEPRAAKQGRTYSNFGEFLESASERSAHGDTPPRSYLSRESQMKISGICSATIYDIHPEPFGDNAQDVLDTIIRDLRSSKAEKKDPAIDVRPHTELLKIPVSERRAMAPHLSAIYDQIYFDDPPSDERDALLAAVPSNRPAPSSSRASATLGSGAARVWGSPREATRAAQDAAVSAAPAYPEPAARRDDEGFWVDFRYADPQSAPAACGAAQEGGGARPSAVGGSGYGSLSERTGRAARTGGVGLGRLLLTMLCVTLVTSVSILAWEIWSRWGQH